MHFLCVPPIRRAVCRNFAKGGGGGGRTWGILKRAASGGALKISLVILRGGEIDTRGGE